MDSTFDCERTELAHGEKQLRQLDYYQRNFGRRSAAPADAMAYVDNHDIVSYAHSGKRASLLDVTCLTTMVAGKRTMCVRRWSGKDHKADMPF